MGRSRTSYVRWYILRDLAHGRILIFMHHRTRVTKAWLAGKGRPMEDVPLRTAIDLVNKGMIQRCSLPEFPGIVGKDYTAWNCNRSGWEEARRIVFGTHEFWSWFGGSYKKSKKGMIEWGLMTRETGPVWEPPTLTEWRAGLRHHRS